jgi:hypothetical protein
MRKIALLMIIMVSLTGCVAEYNVNEYQYNENNGEFSIKMQEVDTEDEGKGTYAVDSIRVMGYEKRCEQEDVLVSTKSIDDDIDGVHRFNFNQKVVDYIKVKGYELSDYETMSFTETAYGQDIKECESNN